jgi:branched-chain amino acid transport system substrate-binding protein
MKLRTKALAALATVAGCLLAAACGGGSTADGSANGVTPPDNGEQPWVIGTIGAFSGPFASNVLPGRYAMQAWAQSVNASGGINGHMIKLVIKDDGADPARALAGIKELVERDKVIAIVGSQEVDSSGYADYLQQKGVPMVGGLNPSSIWDSNPMFFTSVTSDKPLYSALPRLLKEAGATGFGTISCTENPGCASNNQLATDSATAFGLAPRLQQLVKTGLPDYTSVCLAARGAGVDGLAILDANPVVLNIMSSCAKQGYKPKYAVQGASVGLDVTLTNPDTAGAIVASETFPFFSKDTPAQQAFHTALDTYAAGKPKAATGAISWSGAQLFRAAAEAGGLGDNPTPADVVKGLYSLKPGETLDGLAPPLRFVRGQDHVASCYFSWRIGSGSFELATSGNAPICPQPSTTSG